MSEAFRTRLCRCPQGGLLCPTQVWSFRPASSSRASARLPGSPPSPIGVVRRPETALVSWAAMTNPQPQRILVAVAWPYANGPRHIGHVAGFGVPSDIFARYHRLLGDDVLMVSGTDEHGTPIMVAADAAGVSPRELADTNNDVIREDLRRL